MGKREIGGYFQMEELAGKELYPELYHLNLGRTALVALMRSLDLQRIYLPDFLCASVFQTCEQEGYEVIRYGIGYDFLPKTELPTDESAAFYLVNYYGQLSPQQVIDVARQVSHPILDNTHALFCKPVDNIPTIYSLRKFFGLPDGAYLAYDGPIDLEETDRSASRMKHILGRFEESASTYYQDMLQTSVTFEHEEPKEMSSITRNLLRGIDYEGARKRRTANFLVLNRLLSGVNRLDVVVPDGAFSYPLLLDDASALRAPLARLGIYVPTYWKNVINDMASDTIEYDLAANILALPCDHRYTQEDMEYVAAHVLELLG